MKFETYFRLSSLLMIACGVMALVSADGMSALAALVFACIIAISWKLEGTKWQLPERAALALVLLSLPVFALDWKYHILTSANDATENGASISIRIGTLVYFTLFLSSVKLLQKKADRDWFFLYIISFFEILLAAGLSISTQFFVVLLIYTLCALSTVIAFEMRKAARQARERLGEARLLSATIDDANMERRRIANLFGWRRAHRRVDVTREARRLPLVAVGLLLLIFGSALPIFLLVPRYGAGAFARTNNSTVNAAVGFSDEVTLGDIGRLQRSDNVVMRVKVEKPRGALVKELKWRGVALDYFNGHAWRRLPTTREVISPSRGNFYQLDAESDLNSRVIQTFYLEPLDTGAIFAAPRVLGLQASLQMLARDRDNSLETEAHPQERLTYRVYSDTSEPSPEILRHDVAPYPNFVSRDLQLPSNLDPRIANLARQIIAEARATNHYDAARAIENYLRTNYDYSLDMRAGGSDPLADFLFRVRAGHCEYFSTAMAVMLRAQGIPARVVNGFQMGEYNDAADAYTVRQRDAHSWVEVYFPQTNAWIAFDPTPASDPANERARATGLLASLHKWREAFETFWIEYVVTYDRAQQQNLARKMNSRFISFRNSSVEAIDDWRARLSNFWSALFRSDGQGINRAFANFNFARLFVIFVTLLLLIIFTWRARRVHLWRRIFRQRAKDETQAAIEFYERMTRILKSRGLMRAPHQTPKEFAEIIGESEVVNITNAYTQVRYGGRNLSQDDIARIEEDLKQMERIGK